MIILTALILYTVNLTVTITSLLHCSTTYSTRHSASGVFAIVDCTPGTHEYKYFIDGAWYHDPTKVAILSLPLCVCLSVSSNHKHRVFLFRGGANLLACSLAIKKFRFHTPAIIAITTAPTVNAATTTAAITDTTTTTTSSIASLSKLRAIHVG